LREALLQAALKLVDDEGVDAIALREVARLAGVSHAAPYRHFPTKEALLAGVAEEGFRGLLASLQEGAERGGSDILKRLEGTSTGYLRFALKNQAHFRVMFGRFDALADYEGLTTATRAAFGFLLELVTAGQQAGKLRQGDPFEIALAAWSLVHGQATLLVNGRLELADDQQVEDLAARATALLVEGLGADGKPAAAPALSPTDREAKWLRIRGVAPPSAPPAEPPVRRRRTGTP
jgi:AcrR family transcriptional regulator